MSSFFRGQDTERGSADLPTLIAIGVLFFAVAGAVLYFLIFGTPPLKTDAVAKQVLSSLSTITSYNAKLSLRSISSISGINSFTGTFSYDEKNAQSDGQFEIPLSVTTGAPKVATEVFLTTGENFAKLAINDTLSKSVMQFPAGWFRVLDSEKPDQYAFLQGSGVFTDAIHVLQSDAAKITVKGQAERQMNDQAPQIHIVFHIPETNKTPLSGKDIDVFVDTKSYSLQSLSFNTSSFSVSEDISNINQPFGFVLPVNALSYSDWKSQLFSSSVASVAPVSQIFIGSYGNINAKYLEGIRSGLQKITGAKTMLLAAAPALEKKAPLFDVSRQQWNADVLLQGVQNVSNPYGQGVRILYVIDSELYSPTRKDLSSIRSLGSLGSNAAVMTISGIEQNLSAPIGTSTPALSNAVIISRALKIAENALGLSMGFGNSPSTLDPKCVTHSAVTVADLDAQTAGYCAPEKNLLKNLFKK